MDRFSLTSVAEKMPRSKDMTQAAKDATEDEFFQCERELVTSTADMEQAIKTLKRSLAGFRQSVRATGPTHTHTASPDMLL